MDMSTRKGVSQMASTLAECLRCHKLFCIACSPDNYLCLDCATPLDHDVLKAKVDSLRWFHSIDLGNGIITPGEKGGAQSPERGLAWMKGELETLRLPALKDKTVLDIGCRDGYYAFEAERQGASVVAIDTWDHPDWDNDETFNLAYDALHSRLVYEKYDVYDIDEKWWPEYDVVLLLGVLYHLKHPLLALEKIAAVTGDLLVVESNFNPKEYGDMSIMRFLPGDELNIDSTCWWQFTKQVLVDMLLIVGFAKVEEVSRRDDRIVIHAHKRR